MPEKLCFSCKYFLFIDVNAVVRCRKVRYTYPRDECEYYVKR